MARCGPLPDDGRVARYLFSSHDGFGLGHVRRNAIVARAVLAADPGAEVTLVTGVAVRPSWLGDHRMRIVRVPSMLKDTHGAYTNEELAFDEAIRRRSAVFDAAVDELRPDVIVVDRHPYGLAGELRPGIERARGRGTAVVLGLRDVLDEPATVRGEIGGHGWDDVAELFDHALVYGDTVVCDHEAEYGLPLTPTYCGWVTERPIARRREADLLVFAAGGGGDGCSVFRLGVELSRLLDDRRAVLVSGPYGAADAARELIDGGPGTGRVQLVRDAAGCVELFARAGGVVQMAGYNSTIEALAAGIRPVLVPRRSPRREQAIRASRLAALGLADVVDEDAPAEEVVWLLQRDRVLADGQLAGAGIHLDGAHRAAEVVTAACGATLR